MNDAGLVRELMVAPEPVVVQLGRGTVSGARDGARSVRAADNLGGEVVDRHDAPLIALLSARRQRRISAHSQSAALLVIDLVSPAAPFGIYPPASGARVI